MDHHLELTKQSRPARAERRAEGSAPVSDLGGRVTYAHDRFGVSFEGIYRRVDFDKGAATDEEQYRLVGTLEYRIGDEEWLSFSFGHDYGDAESAPLIALANLQWNFGRERSVEPDTDWTVPRSNDDQDEASDEKGEDEENTLEPGETDEAASEAPPGDEAPPAPPAEDEPVEAPPTPPTDAAPEAPAPGGGP